MIDQERHLDIHATPNALWAVLGRFMHIDEFAPFVDSVDALTDGDDGVGSKRRCNLANGTSLVEEVTVWEPNRRYRVRLLELDKAPFREAHAEISVRPLDNERSRVKWRLELRMKFGPFGWLLGQTVLKRTLGKVLEANLQGLADAVRPDPAAASSTLSSPALAPAI